MQNSNLKNHYKTALKGGSKWYHKPINWLLILICIILPIPLFRYLKRQFQKNNEQEIQIQKDRTFIENQNPIVVTAKADKITSRKDIQAGAKDLAHHLGTKYSDKNAWWSFLDPRGWTENDKKAADILIYQRNNYKLLERLYFSCYTNSRSLSDDVLKLLDESQLKRVQQKLKI